MNNKDTGTFLFGFLIGGLAGAVTTIFLTPQSGEETREQLQQKGIELQERAEKTLAETQTKVDAVIADVKERVQVLQAQRRAIMEEGPKQFSQAVEETKEAATTVTETKAEAKP